MSQASPDFIDRLRQPEYVGENRCIPCTAVNVVIAVLLGAAVWIGVAPVTGAEIAGVHAATVLGVSLAAIYLRGYVVPGTPSLTKQYFPERVLRWFDKAPADVDAPVAGSAGDVEAEPILLDADAVEVCMDGEDLCATDAFAGAWREEIESLRDGGDLAGRMAEVLDADESEIEIATRDSFAIGGGDDQASARWEARAALLADAAAYRPLSERVDAWDDLELRDRGQLLNGVRVFLEQCPSCDAPVGFSEETRESCCREVDVVALECTECDAQLLEVEA
jgi:hypothetical protein